MEIGTKTGITIIISRLALFRKCYLGISQPKIVLFRAFPAIIAICNCLVICSVKGNSVLSDSLIDSILNRSAKISDGEINGIPIENAIGELDEVIEDRHSKDELKYKAATAKYQIQSLLGLNRHAAQTAKLSVSYASNYNQKAEATLSLASSMLRQASDWDSQSIETACADALLCLQAYTKLAAERKVIITNMGGKVVALIPDPTKYIFREIDLLVSYSNYLESIKEDDLAWQQSSRALTLLRANPEKVPYGYADSIYFQNINQSLKIGKFNTAAKEIITIYSNERVQDVVKSSLIKSLAYAMLASEDNLNSFMPSADFPLLGQPKILALFEDAVIEQLYIREEFFTAIRMIERSLGEITEKLEGAIKGNQQEKITILQERQLRLLGVLNSCYVRTGKLSEARAIGNVMKALSTTIEQNRNEKNNE